MQFSEREFFKDSLTRNELSALIGGRKTAEFFATRSPSVKKLGLNIEALSDAEMRRLMLAEPRLMRRPLLKVGRRMLVGFKAEDWEAAL